MQLPSILDLTLYWHIQNAVPNFVTLIDNFLVHILQTIFLLRIIFIFVIAVFIMNATELEEKA